ncbi:MAG: N-acetylmuramic acid 6-phosphate etherase [Planctomycetota bacterium]|nr:MAG: N-acetylmuramic acid 6-phosphate etherase [Planctomycetota bacterium]
MQVPLPPSASTEARNTASGTIDSLSALQIVELMNSEDAMVAAAVRTQSTSIAAAIDVVAEAFRNGGRLIYIGAGTSGRLGVLDASECPPTFSVPRSMVVGLIAGGPSALTSAIEGAEDRAEQGRADLENISLTARDIVMGIAASGRTPYVLGGLQFAREVGATTIGFACNDESALIPLSDIMIAPVVGPEVITGSTRLKAGTATKMVLNMLTTGAMVRIGKTFGNLMVDLTASNEKLRDRSQRIVSDLTGLSSEAAQKLLSECSHQVKTAIVVHHRKLTPEAAREQLKQCNGHLRNALQQ